jgi:hypothetical protein
MKTQFSTSTEFYRAKIQGIQDGSFVDPTTKAVLFKFAMTEGAPAVDPITNLMISSQGGSWESSQPEAPDWYYARTLIASGQLTAGLFYVYCQVSDSPEFPVMQVGTLTII